MELPISFLIREDTLKRCMWMLCLAAFLPGCLSQAHYEELMGQANDVKTLKQNDRKQDKRLDNIEKTLHQLRSGLRPEIQGSGVKVEAVPVARSGAGAAEVAAAREVRVTLPQAVLFASGSVRIDRRGRRVLDKVVETLHDGAKSLVRIVGYSDARPIGKTLRSRYRDNWELSAARASAVARYLAWGRKISKDRIVVEARGAANPVASNATVKGRAKNRRIEIFIAATG